MIDLVNTLAYPCGIPFNNPVLRFYAVFILIGAFLALLLSNYHAYQDGYDMHFFDGVFFVAFPSGIIGARIWYVIASFNEFVNRPFWHVFAIWEGGLAIQGGAIGGILAGVIYCIFRRKGVSILKCMEWAIPTILVAQAIGRWGNFFNQEVYGHAVSLEAWNFLPSFITDNMQNGTSSMIGGGMLPSNSIAAPLFLVEGVVNLMFYFLINNGIKALLRKKYVNGDSAFAYFIAYGIVRLILEPLRNASFIMGTSTIGDKADYKSYWMALAFIIIGVVLIAINHVLNYLAMNGKLDKVKFLKNIYCEEDFIKVVKVKKEDNEEDDLSKLKQLSEK